VTDKTFSYKECKENIHAKSLTVAYTPLAVKIRKYAAEFSTKLQADDVSKVQKQNGRPPFQKHRSNPCQFCFENESESLLLRREIEQLKLRNKVLAFGIKRMQRFPPTN